MKDSKVMWKREGGKEAIEIVRWMWTPLAPDERRRDPRNTIRRAILVIINCK